jgi:subtilisin-like proprotein convertase family protein
MASRFMHIIKFFRVPLLIVGGLLITANICRAQVTHTFTNTTPLAIPATGPSSPYGTTIVASGVRGTVTNVTVTLKNLTHANPAELHVIVRTPAGLTVALLEQTSGPLLPQAVLALAPADHRDLVFTDRATYGFYNRYPDAGPYQPGGANPTGSSLPAPAPPAPYAPRLDTCIGSLANGTWTLYVFDESGPAFGALGGGWELAIDSAESTAPMTVGTSLGPSTNYGAPITVANLKGLVNHITVTLYQMDHTYPEDLDVLLVAPTGKAVMLMSDAGGATDVHAPLLTFDDTAASAIPDNAPITSGSYKPADYAPSEILPAPAPAGPYGSDLDNLLAAAINGPNGVWHLYVNDHTNQDGGQIIGWSLDIQTAGELSVAPISGVVIEGGTYGVTLVRTGGSNGIVGVGFGTVLPAPAAHPATPGVDYGFTASPITFGSGVTVKSSALATINDPLVEPTENNTMNLFSPTGGAVIGQKLVFTFNILDDELGVWSIAPTAGLIDGGTDVTLVVSNAQAGALVTFGNVAVPIRKMSQLGPNQFEIHVLTPPHGPGTVNVTFTNPNQQTFVLPSAYTYIATPGNSSLDTDGDGMPDAWELRFGLDPLNAADAALDPDGDGRTNLQEYQHGTHPFGYYKRYLAEGATGGFFNTSIALLNVESTPAMVIYEFQKSDGSMTPFATTVDGLRRATLDPASVLGGAEFSTLVESDRQIVVDRTMTWPADNPYGSHLETAASGGAKTWFLAEGATNANFDLFYLLQNPNDVDVIATVQYDLPAPQAPIVKTYPLAAHSRRTVHVNDEAPALAWNDIAAEITADHDVIVERAMYRSGNGRLWDAGHDGAGVTTPSTHWFFAEGATGKFFDLFLLLMNPTGTDATVQVSYLLTSGEVVLKSYPLAAHARQTVYVDSEDPKLADAAVSMTVESSTPIVAERAMWWPDQIWYESHDSAGATETGTRWAVAEGEDGGTNNTQTYILIANTSAYAGAATVVLLFEDGTQAVKTFPLEATSRFNVAVGAEFTAAHNRRFAAIVQSRNTGSGLPQIVVERSVYADGAGQVWNLGGNSLGTKLQ